MNPGKKTLLFLACCGMELSWLYGWASFLTTSLLKRPFPLPDATASFALAAGITSLSRGRGWRVILVLGLQMLGLAFAFSRIAYVFYYGAEPFLRQAWLHDLFSRSRSALDWVTLIFVLLLTLSFWVGGVTLARRPTTYLRICTRFDWGLAAFFLLFLARFLIRIQGGLEIDDPVSFSLLFPFLIFALLAIGLVRIQGEDRRDFLPGYQGMGVVLSFTLLVFLFGTGLVLFFLPYLTVAAEVGYRIIRTGAEPLGAILVTVLRFMYFRSSLRPEESSPAPDRGPGYSLTPQESSGWVGVVEKILAWGLWGLLGLALLMIVVISAYYLIRWLFSRTARSHPRQRDKNPFSRWIATLHSLLLSLWEKLAQAITGYGGVIQIYAALLRWGRHSGFSHSLSETPREYGFRLTNRFPALKGEIDSIIESFHEEVYGEITLGEQQWAAARSAWRTLRSPSYWPSRLKAWFLRPRDRSP